MHSLESIKLKFIYVWFHQNLQRLHASTECRKKTSNIQSNQRLKSVHHFNTCIHQEQWSHTHHVILFSGNSSHTSQDKYCQYICFVQFHVTCGAYLLLFACATLSLHNLTHTLGPIKVRTGDFFSFFLKGNICPQVLWMYRHVILLNTQQWKPSDRLSCFVHNHFPLQY